MLLPFVQITYIYVYYPTLYTWDETRQVVMMGSTTRQLM